MRDMRTGGNLRHLTTAFAFAVSLVGAVAAQDSFLTLDSPVETNGQFQFTLKCQSGATYFIEDSEDLQNWITILTNADWSSNRVLAVDISKVLSFYRARRGAPAIVSPWPIVAVIAKNGVTLKGNNIVFDSFNSTNSNYSTGGAYDFSKREANGNIISGVGNISVGNAEIKGKLYTGPTGGYTIASGSVGDLSWASSGVEQGWAITNYVLNDFLDVVAPYSTGFIPSGLGTNKYVLMGNTSYFLPGDLVLQSGETMLVNGVGATLYVVSNLTMAASSAINFSPGASLRLYVGGNAAFGQVNNSGMAADFRYFGLAGNTAITWSGPGSYIGTIYAPEAVLAFAGGSPYSSDFSGACMVNSCTINGKFAIHCDEAQAAP